MQQDADRLDREVADKRDWQAERSPITMAVVDATDLFAGRREVRIRHRGEFYRLIITRNGKLILNK